VPAADKQTLREDAVNTELILLILGAVLALPGGLFVAYLISEPRARWASLLGGIIGAGVVSLGMYYFVQTSGVGIDGLSYFLGIFFAGSIGVMLGALVVNFLVGLGAHDRDLTPVEF
jgi:phosphate/sulfate permease